MLQVEACQGRSGLAALASDWRRLEARSRRRRFFHHHGWWKSYLDALDDSPDSVWFFAVRDSVQTVAIIPLARQPRGRRGLVRRWALPSHAHLPLNGILCDPDADMAAVMGALTQKLQDREFGGWDTLIFHRVLAESALAEYAARVPKAAIVTKTTDCDSLACGQRYEDVAARFSRNFRSNLNKARNKLARENAVAFQSETELPGLTRSFAHFLDIEASGWKGSKGTGTAIKLHPELVRFYGQLLTEFAPRREAMINTLLIAGTPIAAQFCVKDSDTLYVLKLAYDEEWSRLAPGNMLLERVVEKGIRDGDFQHVNLVGDPPWFRDWRPESQDVYNIQLFGRTPAGLVLHAAARARRWLKPYYHKYVRRQGTVLKSRAA